MTDDPNIDKRLLELERRAEQVRQIKPMRELTALMIGMFGGAAMFGAGFMLVWWKVSCP